MEKEIVPTDFREKIRKEKKRKTEGDSSPTKDSLIVGMNLGMCVWRKLCRLHL